MILWAATMVKLRQWNYFSANTIGQSSSRKQRSTSAIARSVKYTRSEGTSHGVYLNQFPPPVSHGDITPWTSSRISRHPKMAKDEHTIRSSYLSIGFRSTSNTFPSTRQSTHKRL